MLVLTATAFTPGTLATPRSNSSKKSARRAGIGILAFRQRHSQRQDAFGLESQRDASHGDDASDHEARADQQHHRQRDGADHERLAQERLRLAAGRILRLVLSGFVKSFAQRVQRRRETEDQARREATPAA